LVLGTGGASKAVGYGLQQLGIDFTFVSRNPDNKDNTIAYQDVNEKTIKEHSLIINTSPLGMYPNTDEAPEIHYNALTSNHILYDLIYNPELTRFMELGREYNARVKNGYEMLMLQAEKSWEIWNA
jgi:shikimate dehydrogenase